MNEQETNWEELYGPAAPFSDHKRGEKIRFFDAELEMNRTATILWVCAADPVKKRPVRYVVDTPGFPSIVYTGEVIE